MEYSKLIQKVIALLIYVICKLVAVNVNRCDPQKRPQRRPSTGNLLSDDHTSEEELLPSDTEEARKERAFDEVSIFSYT
jgi:hypothetical protein